MTDAAFQYNGLKIWNISPYSIRSIPDIVKFKKCFMSHYFEIAFNGITGKYFRIMLINRQVNLELFSYNS